MQYCISDYAEVNKPAARKGKMVRVSKAAKMDLKEWRRIGARVRKFVEKEPQ